MRETPGLPPETTAPVPIHRGNRPERGWHQVVPVAGHHQTPGQTSGLPPAPSCDVWIENPQLRAQAGLRTTLKPRPVPTLRPPWHTCVRAGRLGGEGRARKGTDLRDTGVVGGLAGEGHTWGGGDLPPLPARSSKPAPPLPPVGSGQNPGMSEPQHQGGREGGGPGPEMAPGCLASVSRRSRSYQLCLGQPPASLPTWRPPSRGWLPSSSGPVLLPCQPGTPGLPGDPPRSGLSSAPPQRHLSGAVPLPTPPGRRWPGASALSTHSPSRA